MKVPNLKWLFLSGNLLIILLLASCRPSATPVPTPSPSPASAQQIAPTATLTIPPVAVKSGIRIMAKLGNTCPGPQRSGQVCEKPYQGEFSIITGPNTVAISATTDQEGQVTVELPPGQYTVTPKIEGRFPSGVPVDVTVPLGEVVEVSIELDSGIR